MTNDVTSWILLIYMGGMTLWFVISEWIDSGESRDPPDGE